ncbi:MAG: hypothetical protein MJE66_03975 [Proteobacteria bacterium]|nr:hypothetical protein [Pseudomonadota bacterium]
MSTPFGGLYGELEGGVAVLEREGVVEDGIETVVARFEHDPEARWLGGVLEYSVRHDDGSECGGTEYWDLHSTLFSWIPRPQYDLTGEWWITTTPSDDSCAEPLPRETRVAWVVQDENGRVAVTLHDARFEGTLWARWLTLHGAEGEDPDVAEFHGYVRADEEHMLGFQEWRTTEPSGDIACDGVDGWDAVRVGDLPEAAARCHEFGPRGVDGPWPETTSGVGFMDDLAGWAWSGFQLISFLPYSCPRPPAEPPPSYPGSPSPGSGLVLHTLSASSLASITLVTPILEPAGERVSSSLVTPTKSLSALRLESEETVEALAR